MSETTNPSSALEKEHLNKIIAVLIEQNDGLKKENEWLKIRIGLTEQGKSDAEIGKAFEACWKSDHEIVNGFPARDKSNDKINIGFKAEEKSNDKTGIGFTASTESNAQIDNGLSASNKSNDKTGIGQTAALEPLPQIISPDGLIISALVGTLTASGFRYVEKSTLRNAAALMIHFYNKGDGAYPELRKVTKLSTGGISKFMTSMRKRGLIQRYAYKKYELTAHGIDLLKQAYSKVKK